MVKHEMFTNLRIYSIATNLIENFKEDLNLPVRVSFYLQRNMNTIITMAQELDKERTAIFDKYGTQDEEQPGRYHFEDDVIDTANKEVEDLFNLEQEVSYNVMKLDWFDDVELNSNQVAAISWMFDEEE